MINLVGVNGQTRAADLRRLNAMWPDAFLPLKDKHLRYGDWWIALTPEGEEAGFCGSVPFGFDGYCYLKRAGVLPKFQGQGLQFEMIAIREHRAKGQGFKYLVSECETVNVPSANNFIRAGFKLFEPERPWASDPSLYWIKPL